MKHIHPIGLLTLLPLCGLFGLFWNPGCAPFVNAATATVESVGKAIPIAATAGARAHIVEVDAIASAATKLKTDRGCASLDDPPCKDDGAALRARYEAALKRYDTFKTALRTADAAATEAAIGLDVYTKSQGDGFDIRAVIAGLVKAWATLASLLREYGVTVPEVRL